jgi:AcrR family transcriptional regulator
MASKSPADAWNPDPLPRGRHKLSRQDVLASQRERLLHAMADLVSEQGYENTTVPQVVARARVSSNAFYEFFDDKTSAFVALCEQAAEGLFTEMASFAGEPSWLDALDKGMDMYLQWWQRRPALTIAYLVELPSAGKRVVEERAKQMERFSTILRYMAEWARREDPSLPPIDEVTLAVAVAAPTEVIGIEVRAGRLDDLSAIRDPLRNLLVKLLADDATVSRARARSPQG